MLAVGAAKIRVACSLYDMIACSVYGGCVCEFPLSLRVSLPSIRRFLLSVTSFYPSLTYLHTCLSLSLSLSLSVSLCLSRALCLSLSRLLCLSQWLSEALSRQDLRSGVGELR
jgi:hypothetical protein